MSVHDYEFMAEEKRTRDEKLGVHQFMSRSLQVQKVPSPVETVSRECVVVRKSWRCARTEVFRPSNCYRILALTPLRRS